MKLQKILLAFLAIGGLFNANAADNGCNRSTAEPTDSSIIKYTYDTESSIEYKFDLWWLNCDDSVQLFTKAYTKTGVDEADTGSADDVIFLYQKGERYSYFDLFPSGMEITSGEPLYRLVRYDKGSEFDFNEPTEICISVGGYHGDPVCNTIFPQNKNGSSSAIFSITGTWYDPAYNGSGFNVVESTNGLFVYFYGYKADGNGQAQWLVSEVGPKAVKKGQELSLKVYEATEGNGANFITGPASGSGISEWGNLTLTFNTCSSGTIALDGADGQLTHNVVKLANVQNLTCSE